MNRQFAVLSTVGFLFGAMTIPAFAEQDSGTSPRVIEETLVLKDPTVSASGKWVFGAALEGFYVHGKYKQWNSSGVTDTGTINAFKPGLNLFAGYGEVTVNYVYRSGKEDVDMNNVQGFAHTKSGDQKENEITVRWLIRDLSTTYFTPYVYAGYVDIKSTDTDTITTPGWTWTSSGTAVAVSTSEWKGTTVGIGGIIPVTAKAGLRLDGGVNSTSATWSSYGQTASGSGTGMRLTGTIYYNLAQGWNIQAGGRYEYLNGGNIGNKYRTGLFAMLGYSYK